MTLIFTISGFYTVLCYRTGWYISLAFSSVEGTVTRGSHNIVKFSDIYGLILESIYKYDKPTLADETTLIR